MKRHLLLIGFSCTGKTTLGKKAFGEGNITDSDEKVRERIGASGQHSFKHIYEVYMGLGRDEALRQIEEAEEALIDFWAADTSRKIISLGPAFPLRNNWAKLRDISHVVLFQKSAEAIYEGMQDRRRRNFEHCPDARQHDNWDIDVIVDDQRQEFAREDAIWNIQRLLDERAAAYSDNDDVVVTGDQDATIKRLKDISSALEGDELNVS